MKKNNCKCIGMVSGGTYDHNFESARRVYSVDYPSPTLTAHGGGNQEVKIQEPEPSLRIRKLTPKECWRLMGFTDEDFEKAQEVNSDTQLYKQAGNSIVVNVLMAIFKQML